MFLYQCCYMLCVAYLHQSIFHLRRMIFPVFPASTFKIIIIFIVTQPDSIQICFFFCLSKCAWTFDDAMKKRFQVELFFYETSKSLRHWLKTFLSRMKREKGADNDFHRIITCLTNYILSRKLIPQQTELFRFCWQLLRSENLSSVRCTQISDISNPLFSSPFIIDFSTIFNRSSFWVL